MQSIEKLTEKLPRLAINAAKPVAIDSPDHLIPWGTARDNSTHAGFNEKLSYWIPRKDLSVLDLGCSGGGFVRSVIEQGGYAVGVEGSDFSLRAKRAEWATIPDFLFTADVTAPFTLGLAENLDPSNTVKFSVITAWEMIEHVTEENLVNVFNNIDRHLVKGGCVIMSISPNDDIINGVNLHQCVHDASWWFKKLEDLGWKNHPWIVDFFGKDWIRSEPNAPGSFHVVLTRRGEFPIFAERVCLEGFAYVKAAKPKDVLCAKLGEAFGFSEDPVVLLDCGSAGGPENPWKKVAQFCHFVGLDARDGSSGEGEILSNPFKKVSLIEAALDRSERVLEFYETTNGVSSSFLETNREFSHRFPQDRLGLTVGTQKLRTSTLNRELRNLGVGRVDYLKLDVEGKELDVILGASDYLRDILCISIEVFFQDYRFGSPKFGEIETTFRALGFDLFDLELEHWKRNCVADPNDPRTWYGRPGQVIWGQALFFKDPLNGRSSLDMPSIKRLSFLAASLGFDDFAIELINKFRLVRIT